MDCQKSISNTITGATTGLPIEFQLYFQITMEKNISYLSPQERGYVYNHQMAQSKDYPYTLLHQQLLQLLYFLRQFYKAPAMAGNLPRDLNHVSPDRSIMFIMPFTHTTKYNPRKTYPTAQTRENCLRRVSKIMWLILSKQRWYL